MSELNKPPEAAQVEDAAPHNSHLKIASNGHVSGMSRAQSEPYFSDAPFVIGTLADDHRALLKNESGLSDEAIAARGYWTCEGDKATLRFLGLPANIGRCLIVPLWNQRGERVGLIARLDIPFIRTTEKSNKYLMPKGAAQVVDVAPLTRYLINDPNEVVIATEGAKKVDAGAMLRFPGINVNGVFGYKGTNDKGGIATLAAWDEIVFTGKDAKGQKFGRVILVCFDSDVTINPKVEKGLRGFSALAASRGAIVKIVEFEPGPNNEKTGLDDFVARDGGTREQLLSMARDLESVSESRRKRKEEKSKAKLAELQADGVPVIETNDRQLKDELKDLSAAIAQYNKPPKLFHGVAGLMMIGQDKDANPVLQTVSREALQVIASKAARWISTSEREGIRNVAPPRDLCQDFLESLEDWQDIPPIDRIMTAPFVDADGSICSTPGYHAKARVWLNLKAGFVIPDTLPTPEKVAAAKRVILDVLLGEVAFAADPLKEGEIASADSSARSSMVGAMIAPFVRRLIAGQTPLILFDGPGQSSGKTYAARICIAPFTEAIPSTIKSNEEENRKALLAKLATGCSHVFYDNIKTGLSDATLAAAITTEVIEDRLIGTGQMVRCSTNVVWIATSNNAVLDRDAASRCVKIRLDPNVEDPEGREFKGNPLHYIAENRGAVIGAILTLVRNWQKQGCPAKPSKTLTRFPEWEKVIGGILAANGIGKFLADYTESRRSLDPDATSWCEFVAKWHEKHSSNEVTTKDLLPAALECDELAALIGEKEGKAARFGKMLLSNRDKVFAGFKIRRSTANTNVAKWSISPPKKPTIVQNEPESGRDSRDNRDSSLPTRKPENLTDIEENEENTEINELSLMPEAAPIIPIIPTPKKRVTL